MSTESIIILAVSVPLFILTVIFLTAYVSYRMAFLHHPREIDPREKANVRDHKEKIIELINELCAEKYEEVTITSRDGLTLFGRYYDAGEGTPLEIQFHGYKSCSRLDYSGSARDALKKGRSFLLVDQRAHGKSEGHTITFGIKERYDLLDWVEYARRRFGDERDIILLGMSMGAATVLMASELPLPKCVRFIVADCPYSSPEEIIRRVIRNMGLPDKLMFPFVKLGARVFGGFDLTESSAIEAIKNATVPTLIVHGTDDSFVPYEMSERMVREAGRENVELVPFPGADHGLSYFSDYEKYHESARRFREKYLRGDKNDNKT